MQTLKTFIASPLFRIYWLTLLISVGLLVWVGVSLGLAALFTALILVVLEVSLSFDNAVVNAKVLKNMSEFWRKIFLTVGILIAVFGVRVVLPVLLVAAFARMSVPSVVDLVFRDPERYGEVLHGIHPEIAAFGGMFLLVLFLDYVFGTRPILWIKRVEKPLLKAGQLERLEIVIALSALLAAVAFAGAKHAAGMLVAGIIGLILYVALKSFGSYFESRDMAGKVAQAGLAGFLYLEVLDASFSLDGVLGAFAITSNILVIMVGLGIGALWVRSMTIHLVKTDTLAHYRYLEHGAHYAIGALAILLLVSAGVEIPEVVTGLIGLAIILAALADSILTNRRERRSVAA